MLGIALLLGTGTDLYAQENGQPVTLHFRIGRSTLDSAYMDNARSLHHLVTLFSEGLSASLTDSVNILAFASPDGSRAYNERLAVKRSETVKAYLERNCPHLDPARIRLRPEGENWRGLWHLAAKDPNLPNREEVLRIIRQATDSNRCKDLLKRLDHGSSYRYILEQMASRLRNATVYTVRRQPDSVLILLRTMPPCTKLPHARNRHLPGRITPWQVPAVPSERTEDRKPLFALKTNLLFDAALMPNVELEVPIGRRWSVNAEYMFPWWLLADDKYALQILTGALEGRYWLGNRERRTERDALTGHFIGLYAGGGKYDLQWDKNGYQGEFFIASGISYGYAHKINRHLRLEYSIGIGLLRTNYRHYQAIDNHQILLWQENGKYTWFGPTKAKVSLVWMLTRKARRQKGGAE